MVVLLCIPLDHTREAERGILMSGQPTSFMQLPRLVRREERQPTDLEALAADQNVWRLTTKSAAVKIEQKLKEQHKMKTQRRPVRAASDTLDNTAFVCSTCKKTCRSRIGLYSHSRRCSSTMECQPRRKPIVFRDRKMPTNGCETRQNSCQSISRTLRIVKIKRSKIRKIHFMTCCQCWWGNCSDQCHLLTVDSTPVELQDCKLKRRSM